MLRARTLTAVLFVALSGCGSPPAPETPPAASATPEAPPASSAEPSASADPAASAAPATSAAPSAPEAAPSESAALAREILKSGGRRIGYSAGKKSFVYPVERRVQNGFSLDVQFLGEDGSPRDALRVCQPGECEDKLDEILKEFLPKLTERLDRDGFTAIRAIGWPSGGDELEVSTLSMKIRYSKGRLEAVREGKPAAGISPLGGKRLDEAPKAIFVVPNSKLLAAFVGPGGDAKGLVQELHLFKLP